MKKILLILITLLYTAPVYATKLPNPIKITDPNEIIGGILKGILSIIGTVALLVFIYGGLKILLSVGESTKVKEGRDIMIYAAIGLAIIFGSYELAKFVIGVASLK